MLCCCNIMLMTSSKPSVQPEMQSFEGFTHSCNPHLRPSVTGGVCTPVEGYRNSWGQSQSSACSRSMTSFTMFKQRSWAAFSSSGLIHTSSARTAPRRHMSMPRQNAKPLLSRYYLVSNATAPASSGR